MIKAENLSRYYGSRRAVENISFEANPGEVLGFLGPNGSGKTTTMRILTGYLQPTGGDAWIAGASVSNDPMAARRRLGYLPETTPLYTDMTVREFLRFAARMKGVDKRRSGDAAQTAIERCGLGSYADTLLSKLSKGYRQRAGLAQAIVHDPLVLILDEPTSGIDPLQLVEIKQLIRSLAVGRTILLSSHNLPEVSAMCDRVAIISAGAIVANDRIENLSSLLRGGKRLHVKVLGPADEVRARLAGLEGIRSVRIDGERHVVDFAEGLEPEGAIVRAIVDGGWTLQSLEASEMSLEDIFVQLTAKDGKPA